MAQNQITINEEKREQEARKYCDYTFERYGVDGDTQEAQLIRSAHVHGYNAGFEAARNEMKEEFIKSELECIRGYREKAIERLTQLEKESEPSTHEMKVSTETEWHDVYTFCHENLELDDGEVAKITITKE